MDCSGSEIIAAALSENKRAILIGDTSAGSGRISSILPLDKSHVLKITTAHLYSPSGKCLNQEDGKGLAPDILISTESCSELKRILFNTGIVNAFISDVLNEKKHPDVDMFSIFFEKVMTETKIIEGVSSTFLNEIGLINVERGNYLKQKMRDLVTEMIADEIKLQKESMQDLFNSYYYNQIAMPKSIELADIKDKTIVDAIAKLK